MGFIFHPSESTKQHLIQEFRKKEIRNKSLIVIG